VTQQPCVASGKRRDGFCFGQVVIGVFFFFVILAAILVVAVLIVFVVVV
jgi:hypothetical protein